MMTAARKKEKSEMPEKMIVEFPHPYLEFPCARNFLDKAQNVTRWNGGDHCRRLVKHFGQYVDSKGKLREGDLAFWTEWEANTIAKRVQNRPAKNSAKWVHEVLLPNPQLAKLDYTCRAKAKGCCAGGCGGVCCGGACCGANTDPCVFGSSFKYCLCKQDHYPKVLKNLDVGSIILFGSINGGKYYLDTVFVVKKFEKYSTTPSFMRSLGVSSAYKELTLKRFSGKGNVLYRGVTVNDSPDEMFSFTPAERWVGGGQGVGRRCELDIQSLNNLHADLQFRAKRGVAQCVVHTIVPNGRPDLNRLVWEKVRRQVIDKKFVLGTHFDWPKRQCVMRNGQMIVV